MSSMCMVSYLLILSKGSQGRSKVHGNQFVERIARILRACLSTIAVDGRRADRQADRQADRHAI